MTPRHRLSILAICALVVLTAGSTFACDGARAMQATPSAGIGAASPLEELLHLVPDPWAERGDGPIPLLTYVDLGSQFASLGLKPPASWDDAEGVVGFLGATAGLAPMEMMTQAIQNAQLWSDLFGFSALEVDQALEYGTPPSVLSLMRGRFDTTRMRAAWAKSGYQELEPVDGAIVASLVPEGGINLRVEASHASLGRFNNVAILPDGTIAFAPALADIERVLDAAAGRSPSVADQPQVAALVSGLDVPLASAQIIPGDDLRLQPPGPAVVSAATPAAGTGSGDQLPPVRLVLLGLTTGGPLQTPGDANATPAPAVPGEPLAQIVFAAVFDDQTSATTAAPIVEERLATGGSRVYQQPYTEIFGDGTVRAAADARVVLIVLAPGESGRGVWWRLYLAGDLGFLAW